MRGRSSGAVSFGESGGGEPGASLGHRARIADFASIGPGATLSDSVAVARLTTHGAVAAAGAGSVVRRDVPEGPRFKGTRRGFRRRGPSVGIFGRRIGNETVPFAFGGSAPVHDLGESRGGVLARARGREKPCRPVPSAAVGDGRSDRARSRAGRDCSHPHGR